MLIVAVDANFRMKNRLRTGEDDDPSLGPGLRYCVSRRPYLDYIKSSVNEKDVRIDFNLVTTFLYTTR